MHKHKALIVSPNTYDFIYLKLKVGQQSPETLKYIEP